MASLDRKKKQFGFKRILSSIKNSWNGLKSAYKNEQSVYIHLVCTVILLLLSFLLEISYIIGSKNSINISNVHRIILVRLLCLKHHAIKAMK